MPKVVAEHFEQGRALYQAGHDLRELMANADAMEDRCNAEHDALEANWNDDPVDPPPIPASRSEAHQSISDRYRGAEQSLILGFANEFVADVRRAVQPRGRRA